MAKIKKVPDGCIFCGGRPLSAEHFWPQWAAPYMPPAKMHTRGLTRGEVNAPDEVTRRDWSRQGHVGVITIPAVCTTCNNGWMSRMEEAVRPILEPLLRHHLHATVLFRESQDLLATYFAMKVMVADHSIVETAIFSPAELTAMYKERAIPDDLNIHFHYYLGGNRHVMDYNREYRIVRGVDVPLWQTPSQANYTFRFGPLFIQALHLRGGGPRPMPDDDQRFVVRLHPPQNCSRSLPLRGHLDEETALHFQHMLQVANSEPGTPDLVRRQPAPPAAPNDRR